MLEKQSEDVQLVGTALIGGDFTGNARGANAVDLQQSRGGVATRVASGLASVAIGRDCTSSSTATVAIGMSAAVSGAYAVGVGYNVSVTGTSGVAIGRSAQATAAYAVGVGNYSVASASSSTALGSYSTASATKSTALGEGATARITETTSIAGAIINEKDNGQAASLALRRFSGVEVTLMSKEVNLETVAEQTITFPSNVKFWIDEIGILITSIVSLTTQPTIRFAITGTLAKHLAAVITTDLTATGKREIHDPLVPEDGETTLTAGVTIAAVGTTVLGRFYWKGMFVEDE